jgi:hypothetical protein
LIIYKDVHASCVAPHELGAHLGNENCLTIRAYQVHFYVLLFNDQI